MRGVTGYGRDRGGHVGISTRTPHAGSDDGLQEGDLLGRISTRTPHAGSDGKADAVDESVQISTRTPHAGSDLYAPPFGGDMMDFNPHSPCGE